MREMREVYEMVTGKAPPRPEADAWRRLQDRQRRVVRTRRIGAYALVAALVLGVLVFSLVSLSPAPSGPATQSPSATTSGSSAEIVSGDGNVVSRVPNVPAGAEGLRLSPDGRTIAFMLNGQVATIGIHGSGLTTLTSGTNLNEGAEMNAVSWSPDGRQLAYAWSGDIHVIDANGAKDHAIVGTPGGDYEPAWSPDGTKIVYWHGASTGLEGGPPNAEIFSVPATGGTPTRLTRAAGGVGSIDPAWSPDGRLIAYASRGGLWTMRSDGTAERTVHSYDSGGGSAPTWSPDGSKLAFLSLNTFTPGALQPIFDVHVLDLENGHTVTLPLKVETAANAPQWLTDQTLLVNRYG